MNKEINELDRMTIGVREWAVEETIRDVGFQGIEAKVVLGYAKKLEEYVVGGIKEEEKS